jgi:prepilin-type processing-associated H-X9-DG protein
MPTTIVAQDAYGIYTSGGWAWPRTDYGVNMYAFSNRPTCWTIPQFTDGLSQTIFLGEKAYNVAVQAPNWYFDESFFLGGSAGTSRNATALSPDGPSTNYRDNWGSAHLGGVNFVFGDGSVHLLLFSTSPTMMMGLMTPNGGEAVSPPD